MPQVFHVIRCYDCQTFQVQQVKKVSKWVCKMCGAKQSLKKEYGSGSGVDCRKLVQSLNMQKMNTQEPCDTIAAGISQNENDFTLIEEETKFIQTATFESASSKWNQFLDEKNDSTELDVGSWDEKEDLFTTDRDVMLREEKELRKLRRHEWKATKRKRNYESKPYIIYKNAKQPVTENYSRKYTLSKPEQQKSYGNAHDKSGYVSAANQMKQTYSENLSPTGDDKQQTMTRSHDMNSNTSRYQNPRCNQQKIPNKNSMKDDFVNKCNIDLKSGKSTSKWLKFLEVNQGESTEDEDDCDIKGHLERRDQLHVNTNIESENTGVKSDLVINELDKEKENVGFVNKNIQFNLDIDIDEVFEDW